jgi:molecular chaperone GrpE
MSENDTPNDEVKNVADEEEILEDDLFLDEDDAPDGVVNADGYLDVPTGAVTPPATPVEEGEASAATSEPEASSAEAPVDLVAARIAELKEALEASEAQAKEAHERLLRKAADYENAKRRHQKERDDLTKYAAESVLKEIVPVVDDLERAIEHGQNTEDKSFLEGVEMVCRKFVQALERRGVKAVDAVGHPFDPQYHEAIQQVEDPSVPNNTVVTAFQKGYLLHDRLLRPALVVVAQGGPSRVPEAADAPTEDAASSDESTE